MDHDFGIILDPYTVTQRHTLYDSDEEETEENVSGCFSISSETQLQELSECTLLIAVGQTAAIFTKSYLILEPEPFSVITTNSLKALKDKCFAEKGVLAEGEVLPVSELYRARKKSTSSRPVLVCIHEQPLNSEYCNPWSQKVRVDLSWFPSSSTAFLSQSWLVSPATPFAEEGSGHVATTELSPRNAIIRPLRLGNNMLTSTKHVVT